MLRTIGSFNAVVTSARINEFKNKEGTKTFKKLEVSFFSDDLKLSGILHNWDCSFSPSALPYGTQVVIFFDRCNPMKGSTCFYEFSGDLEIRKDF